MLLLAFIATLATAGTALVGAAIRSTGLLRTARHAQIAALLLWFAMSAALIYSIVTHDFSNKYIAAYSDRNMPFAYLMSAFWGGEKGALLFWATVLSTFTAVSVLTNRTQSPVFLGWVNGILHLAILFFAALMVYESNPFETFLSFGGPEDGKGMNPLLQNPFMAIHPPAMLTGYMTFTVPFAFGTAALITGKLDAQWIRDTRKWTLVSWMFLTIGLILGGAWAYQELGWGGFWMWDPVENAGLIPWFTATAFLHSVMIQERRNMLRRWNAVLVCLTFLLTIFGTFLTRSQLIDSVHAFADSTLAPWFLWYMAVIVVVSAILLAWRWKELRSAADIDSLVSRESFFVLNNVLLVGCAFIVIWGTLFSKVSEAEAFRALYNRIGAVLLSVGIPADPMLQAVELGEPWFNRVMTPMGLALLLMTGVGPLIPWRRATRKNLERNFRKPVQGAALITFFLVVGWSLRSVWRLSELRSLSLSDAYPIWADGIGRGEMYGVVCVFLAMFVTITMAIEFHIGARSRMRSRSESYPNALLMLTLRNKRRYGGYIVHMGIVFSFLAFTGTAFRIYQPEVSLDPGDRTEVGQYSLMFTRAETVWEPDGAYVRAKASMVAFLRDDVVPQERIDAVLALARNLDPKVRAETNTGSPRVALVFADDMAARRFAEQHFIGTFRDQIKVIGPMEGQPRSLRMGMGQTMLDVARVTPQMAMPIFRELREHFTRRGSGTATVKTVPGQMDFTINFAKEGQRERFVADLRGGPLSELQFARYNDRAGDGSGQARVDVVPQNVGISLVPEVRFYAKHSSPTTEVAIYSTFEHDLYLAMRPQQGQRFITLLAIVFPFVSFLWLGAIVMVLGGAICVWPTRRRQRAGVEQGSKADGACTTAPVAAASAPADLVGDAGS